MKNSILVAVFLVIGLILGGLFTYGAFPRTETVEKIVIDEQLVPYNVTIEKEVPVYINQTIEVEKFLPTELRDDAWDYVRTEYFSDLKYCENESYYRTEIDWELSDEYTYEIYDYGDNEYKVIFSVTGDYDNENECSYNIEVEYYDDYEPSVSID